MCKWNEDKLVKVKIPADLSCDGKEKWKEAKIDRCIASLVKALQDGGIDMRGSCCGHYKKHGWIELQDRRILLVLDYKEAVYFFAHPIKFYVLSLWRQICYSVKHHFDVVWRS